MTLGGLFSGIGGFELAAQKAGIVPVWSNEIDPWCCKVLRKNFDHEIIEEDIRLLPSNATEQGFQKRSSKTMGQPEENKKSKRLYGKTQRHKIMPVDIITGGFPCQPFSYAGKRKGTDDDRYLWPEMLRIIKDVRPSWVIGENVAGIKSMENGKTLDRILTDLEDIGYNTETFLIPACSVGTWHRRDRIWIIAYSNSRHSGQEGGISKGVQGRSESFVKSSSCNLQPREVFEDVSNTKAIGIQRSGTSGQQEPQAPLKKAIFRCDSPGDAGQDRAIKPRVGGVVDGLSDWVDGYWDKEPEGTPRTIKGMKGRADRLKGLGNAIVPQVAYQIFKAIDQCQTEREAD